jgi:hypothetical protein
LSLEFISNVLLLIYLVAVGRPQLYYIKRSFFVIWNAKAFSEHPGIAGSFRNTKTAVLLIKRAASLSN